MRIAHVMAGAPSGGAELFFERLTVALHRAGETILPVIRRDRARAGRLRDGGLAPTQLPFRGPLDVLTTPLLRRRLRAFEPAVVVSWMNRATRATPRGRWVKAGRLGGYYDLKYYRGCDHLVGNTRGIVDWIRQQGWPAERVHHLPNFSPDLLFAPELLFGPERRASEAAPVILAMGRLHGNKAFDVLIRALVSLPEVHAIIAGDGPERKALEELARELGVDRRLQMPGWRQDTAGLLAECDVLVCPSRIEPLGNVIIEAFSAGRPVVAAAVAGPVELIDSGRTGLLVPPEDPIRLAGAIRSVLQDRGLAVALAAAGRSEWQARHSEASVVQRWRETLAAMAATEGKAGG